MILHQLDFSHDILISHSDPNFKFLCQQFVGFNSYKWFVFKFNVILLFIVDVVVVRSFVRSFN